MSARAASRWQLLAAAFGQWVQRRLHRRAERIDRRAEWWARWTQRRLP